MKNHIHEAATPDIMREIVSYALPTQKSTSHSECILASC